jgi:hypothetical protein
MSDDTKRSIAWISAAVVTAIVYGLYSADWTADWWASAILFLLVGAALHPILGVSIVWIEGGWDFDAVVVWASVLAGALG